MSPPLTADGAAALLKALARPVLSNAPAQLRLDGPAPNPTLRRDELYESLAWYGASERGESGTRRARPSELWPPDVEAKGGSPPPPAAGGGGSSDWTITARDFHAQTWTAQESRRDPRTGRVSTRSRQVVQLASGLNYRDAQGQWQPTVPAFEVAEGAFVARRGPHQVRLPAHLAGAAGVEVLGPDQTRLRLAVVGLGWFDPVTGRSALLAEAQDAPGEMLATNQVVYRDAFRGLKASVRYTYTRGDFAQDVILEEAPAPPGAYGLGDQSRLEVYTEVLESSREPVLSTRVLRPESDPQRRAVMVAPDLADTALDFGALRLGRGRAFLTPSDEGRAPVRTDSAAPVVKQWEQIEGRRVLIEGSEFLRLKPLLDTLAPREARSTTTNEVRTAQAGRQLPRAARYAAQQAPAAPRRDDLRESPSPLLAAPRRDDLRESPSSPEATVASASPRGLVLDYEFFQGATDFTFRSDTTYWVDGAVNLYGTTTIEGGTVLKFSPYAGLEQHWAGQVVCATAPYRPAIFTSKDDDSVGEVLPGSTGQPVTPEANEPTAPYLRLWSLEAGTTLQHLHVRYAPLGLAYDVDGAVHTLSHAQFVHCRYALFADTTTLHLRNVLLYDVDTALFGCLFNVTAEHATVHQCNLLTEDQGTSSPFALTNSLLVRVTSLGNAAVTTQDCGTANDDSVFATAGAGAHYLPADSPWRNAGTSNLDPVLREALRAKTTEAPQIHTLGYLRVDTTLNPTVARDTDAPDLGYHAEPIDHVLATVLLENATLTIHPGTVVATAALGVNHYGLGLGDGAKLVADGLPTNPARLVAHGTVQEQATATWAARGPALIYYWDTVQTPPRASFRFTDLAFTQGEVARSYFIDHTLALQDCAGFSGGFPWYYPMGPVGFTNLFVKDRFLATGYGTRNIVHWPVSILGSVP